jgi:outer membrane protein
MCYDQNKFPGVLNVKTRLLLAFSLALACTAAAQSQAASSKVGIIHIQQALVSTEDGKKAVAELQAKFEPTSKKLESMRDEIAALQAELSKGSNTMSEDRRRQLARDIDQKTRDLNRAQEDAQEEFQREQEKVLQTLGQRMMAVISKYSNDNGYSLILDVSNPQSPVLYAANSIDITQDIIKLYDAEAAKAAAATGGAADSTGKPAGGAKPAAIAKPAAQPAR